MKALNRTYRLTFSVILLLIFLTLILRLDFFHSHGLIPESNASEQLNSTSTQKVNIQNKADYCWVCAVHIDKRFISSTFYDKIRVSPAVLLFINIEVAAYFTEQLLSTLRGPPTK